MRLAQLFDFGPSASDLGLHCGEIFTGMRRVNLRAVITLGLIGLACAHIAFAQAPQNGQSEPQQSSSQDRPEGDSVPNAPNPPSLLTPLKQQTQEAPYHPVTGRQRVRWFITNTIGPPHLVGGLFTSAFGTALDRPKEYGPHWGGFADRFGMRLTGVSTGNAMEAGIGALWGEDPRYFRVPDQPFKSRVRNVMKQTFMARRRDATFAPAYARYAATAGNNFLSNTWRVESEANTHDALIRIVEGFAGRMASNAYEEFWPDLSAHVFHKHD